MTREVRPLVRVLSLHPTALPGIHRAWRDDSCVVAVVGIGPVAAQRATERLLDSVDAARVLVAGLAGAIDPALGVGDVLFPAQVIDRASGAVFRPHRTEGVGTLVTSNAIGGSLAGPGTPPRAAGPGAGTPGALPPGTTAVDMETAAIAGACENRGVPWSVVRTISDVPGTLDDSVLQLVHPDGRLAPAAVARLLVRNPAVAARLVRIGRDAQRAVLALTQAVLREL